MFRLTSCFQTRKKIEMTEIFVNSNSIDRSQILRKITQALGRSIFRDGSTEKDIKVDCI